MNRNVINRNFRQAAGGLAVAIGMTGCGAEMAPAKAGDTQQAGKPIDASVSDSLAKLRALDVMSVGGLVLNLPAEARACYGIPCPNSQFWPAYNQELARQGQRVAALAKLAVSVSHNQYLTPHDASEAEAAHQALAALQIVEVGGLIVSVPKNNQSCYNLPCESDKQAAAGENARRVTEAFAIAEMAKAKEL